MERVTVDFDAEDAMLPHDVVPIVKLRQTNQNEEHLTSTMTEDVFNLLAISKRDKQTRQKMMNRYSNIVELNTKGIIQSLEKASS